MRVENLDIKTGHIEMLEFIENKALLRLYEYPLPFNLYGNSKEKLKSAKQNDLLSIVKRRGSNFYSILMPYNCFKTFSPDGSQEKLVWLSIVEETYTNGFFARIGRKILFFRIEADVKTGDWVILEINKGNFERYSQTNNVFWIKPDGLYKKENLL